MGGCAITIRNISEERVIALLQEWNGKRPEGRMADAVFQFRTYCDRFIELEIGNQQELNRVDLMEKYLTGGHGFYVFLRYPANLQGAVLTGSAKLPNFLRHADDCYQSIAQGGPVRMLIGIVQEKLDPNYELGVFIDILERERSAKKKAEEQEKKFEAREAPRPSNVVHYNFGQVS